MAGMLKFFSWDCTRPSLARVVGLTQMMPETWRMASSQLCDESTPHGLALDGDF
jgi:hypothetical protein